MSDENTPIVEEAVATDEPVVEEIVDDPVEPVVEAPAYSDEDADEARLFGWKPPDEWKGEKPAGYIDDPNRYIERLQQSKVFKVMDERQTALKADADERLRKLEAMNAQARERQSEQHKADLAESANLQRAAVETGDVEAYDAQEARKQGLQEPVQAVTAPPQQDPYMAEYEAKNEWIKNPHMYLQSNHDD